MNEIEKLKEQERRFNKNHAAQGKRTQIVWITILACFLVWLPFRMTILWEMPITYIFEGIILSMVVVTLVTETMAFREIMRNLGKQIAYYDKRIKEGRRENT